MAKPMTEEKLPRELPEIGDKYWDAFNQMGLQRNADQLLYDALWKENKRLNEALTLSLAETAKWAYKAGVLMAAQMVEHRDSTKQGGA